jgi:molybdopterin synthase sulfur carrier subunit
MQIQLRYFASVREKLGAGQESLTLPAEVRTVGEVRALLIARGGAWAEVLAEGRGLRMAYDQEMTEAGQVIAEGGELAFFPPVTGG